MAKPSLPQGTRDFDAVTVRKRQYIFNTIKTVFELYGFQPLETPAMENLETLMGKYGDEGDKLIYRILDSGNPFTETFAKNLQQAFLDKKVLAIAAKNLGYDVSEDDINNQVDITKVKPETFTSIFTALFQDKHYLSKSKNNVGKKALRYDLTIPFARYVAMNHGQLTFPFKRYQMQPVWRADRPQRGRYREFYQCDADVVGSKSLWNEIELANIYATVFEKLGIAIEIKINNRKILAALAQLCGGADKMMDITTAIDKLDKIGIEKVKEELTQRGLDEIQIVIIEKYLLIEGDNDEKLLKISALFSENETGKKGIEEISFILNRFKSQDSPLTIDFTLARGLNYYTGIIFEVKANNVQMGSIGGGGRYDNLTGTFGVPDIAGVGISFGVDRIYDVMEELKLFPTDVNVGTQVLFLNLGETEAEKAFELMQQLRAKGISCELFHEKAKFDKQFKYADKKAIPYSIFIGEKELLESNCVVKDLRNGVQETVLMDALKDFAFIA